MAPLFTVSLLWMLLLYCNIIESQNNFLCNYQSVFVSNGIGFWDTLGNCHVAQSNAATGDDASVSWIPDGIGWTDYLISAIVQFIKVESQPGGFSSTTPSVGIIYRAKYITDLYYLSAMYLDAMNAQHGIATSKINSNAISENQIINAFDGIALEAYTDYIFILNVTGAKFEFSLHDTSNVQLAKIRTVDSEFAVGSVGLRTYRASAIFKALYITGPGISYTPLTTTTNPTITPSKNPIISPIGDPTMSPTTKVPIRSPTETPTSPPITTSNPSNTPTSTPTMSYVSNSTTSYPTILINPTASPTANPTLSPSVHPTSSPTPNPIATSAPSTNVLPTSGSSTTSIPTKSPSTSVGESNVSGLEPGVQYLLIGGSIFILVLLICVFIICIIARNGTERDTKTKTEDKDKSVEMERVTTISPHSKQTKKTFTFEDSGAQNTEIAFKNVNLQQPNGGQTVKLKEGKSDVEIDDFNEFRRGDTENMYDPFEESSESIEGNKRSGGTIGSDKHRHTKTGNEITT